MVHVDNEVAPVRIIIDERHSVDIELKKRLKSSINVLKVLRTTHNFDYFKSLRNHLSDLGFVISRQLWFRKDTRGRIYRHVSLEISYLFARKLEILKSFTLEYLNEVIAVSDQILLSKTDSQYVGDVIILLTIVAATPVDVWSESGRRQKYAHSQIFHTFDRFISVENLMRELRIEK